MSDVYAENHQKDPSPVDELSPPRRAAFEASLAQYQAALDRIDKLEAALKAAKGEIAKLQTMLNGKQLEADDMRAAMTRELASKDAEQLRLYGIAEEAQAQRVAHETLFRNILVMLQDFAPPSDPVNVKRPDIGTIGIRSIERELSRLSDQSRKN